MKRPALTSPVFTLLLAGVLLGTLACDNAGTIVRATSDNNAVTPTYTMDQVVAAPITDLVGQRIALLVRVEWENSIPACIPEDPDCPRDKYVASPLTVFFENGDDYVPEKWRGEHRGDMRIESDAVTSEFNKDNVEEYYFNGTLLDRGVVYNLTGAFAYRDWIGGGNPPVDDPEFIAQSNQVTYWSQTFEFRLESVCTDRPYRTP